MLSLRRYDAILKYRNPLIHQRLVLDGPDVEYRRLVRIHHHLHGVHVLGAEDLEGEDVGRFFREWARDLVFVAVAIDQQDRLFERGGLAENASPNRLKPDAPENASFFDLKNPGVNISA